MTKGGIAARGMSSLLEELWAGQRRGFRLCVNPTFQEDSQVNTRGRKKVLAYTTRDQQTQWVLECVEKCGFRMFISVELGGELPVLEGSDGQRVDGANPLINSAEHSIAEFKRGECHVTLGVAAFEGVFEVIDPDTLRRVLTHGVG